MVGYGWACSNQEARGTPGEKAVEVLSVWIGLLCWIWSRRLGLDPGIKPWASHRARSGREQDTGTCSGFFVMSLIVLVINLILSFLVITRFAIGHDNAVEEGHL